MHSHSTPPAPPRDAALASTGFDPSGDAPPSIDDGIDYERRTAQYARLRVDMLALLNPAALPEAGERPDEYLDADVVDAVSVTDDQVVAEARAVRTGLEYDRVIEARRARRTTREPILPSPDEDRRS